VINGFPVGVAGARPGSSVQNGGPAAVFDGSVDAGVDLRVVGAPFDVLGVVDVPSVVTDPVVVPGIALPATPAQALSKPVTAALPQSVLRTNSVWAVQEGKLGAWSEIPGAYR